MRPGNERLLQVLLVEDSPSDTELLVDTLADDPLKVAVTNAETLEQAVALSGARVFDAVLLDLSLPDSQGLETVVRALAAWPTTPTVVLTGAEDEHLGLEAVRTGAQDYLVKGLAGGRVIMRALRYAIERKRAEVEILRMNNELELRVGERTAQLRQLALKLTISEEEQRRRLAELLHDNLQQLLVYSRLTVGEACTLTRNARLRRSLQGVEQSLGEAIEITHSLTSELRPPLLYERGLLPALRLVAEQLREKADLAVELQAGAAAEPQQEIVRVLLLQSIRELLANVVKHSGVKAAVVAIDRHNGQLRVTVSDQGRGIEPGRTQVGAGYGLFSIRERMRQLGGVLEVQSTPGHGTRITLLVTETDDAPQVDPGSATF